MKDEKGIEEKQEMAALYALGALGQHEAQMFENQLQEGDSQAMAEFESFEKIVEALGYSTSSVEPPAYLLDVLKARLQKEDQISATAIPFPHQKQPAPQNVAGGQHLSHSQFPHSSQPVQNYPGAGKQRQSSAAIIIPWALAAMVMVAALVGVWQWKKERAALNSQIAAIKKETELVTKKLDEENQKVFELARISLALRSPNARVIELAGQEVAPSAKADIYWDTSGNQWVVSADLPPAPEGKVYQLWFITAEGAISAGLMKANESGHAFTVVDLPKNIGTLAASGITLEPAGGSQQPTMPIYVKGSVAG